LRWERRTSSTRDWMPVPEQEGSTRMYLVFARRRSVDHLTSKKFSFLTEMSATMEKRDEIRRLKGNYKKEGRKEGQTLDAITGGEIDKGSTTFGITFKGNKGTSVAHQISELGSLTAWSSTAIDDDFLRFRAVFGPVDMVGKVIEFFLVCHL
jgi:hypothetical protein